MTKKGIYTGILLVLLVSVGFAQQALMTQYAETITQEDMRDLLGIIASDAMEGRETGERGQKMTAAFIADRFRRIGLQPVIQEGSHSTYFQHFKLEQNSPGNIYLTNTDNGTTYKNGEDILYYGRYNMTTPETVALVYGADGSEEILESIDLTNKAVLVDASNTNRAEWREISTRAYDKGATVVILINQPNDKLFNNYIKQYGRYFLRSSLGFKQEETVSHGIVLVPPSLAASLLHIDIQQLFKISSDVKSGKKNALNKVKKASITYFMEQKTNEISTENVLGYLEGTDKNDEFVIITAHYDHIGRQGEVINNGADDDGSGTTSVLEVAEAFARAKADGHGPRRSMLFMTVTGEEKGLLGSKYYTDHPVFPLANTVVDLNIDMVGRIDEAHAGQSDYVYLVGADRLSTELHELSEKANSTFTHLDIDYTYNDEDHPDRIYYRSDHWNFARHNIPIIFYFNGTHADYHKPTDTIEKINFNAMKKRAQLVFYTAWVIANRDQRLVIDKLTDTDVSSEH